MPTWSVVIPMFNAASFIEKTLISVFHQSVSPKEIIVIDDASTDGSARLAARIDGGQVHIVSHDVNAGVSVARNTGMQIATGDYVAFLDADDIWDSDHLQELNALAIQFPECRLLSTSFLEVHDNNLPTLATSASAPLRDRRLRRIRYFAEAARQIGTVYSSTAAVRKDVILNIGGFEPGLRMGEDLQFWARVALVSQAARSTRVTVYYRRHAESAMGAGFSASRPIIPVSRAGISPSCRVVEAALQTDSFDPTVVRRRELVAYVDSRVLSSARHALRYGYRTEARGFLRMVRLRGPRWLFYRSLAVIPSKMLLGALQVVKNILNRSR